MSMAIGDNGNLCAAARCAVARRDAERDMRESELQEKSSELMKAWAERVAATKGFGIL